MKSQKDIVIIEATIVIKNLQKPLYQSAAAVG